MKKLTAICAVTLAAACTLGIAGCSSSSTTTSSINSKWYVRTSYAGIQPSAVYTENVTDKEVLVYDISFEEDSGANSAYSIEYDAGHTMTTEFYAALYSWSNSGIPEDYRVADTSEMVYVYTTSFEISGRYVFTSTGETVEFSDKMESVCYFRSARNSLQPVYSYQYVKSTSPANFTPAAAADMCASVQYEYTTYYNKDCTEAKTYYTEDAMSSVTEKTISLSGASNTLFDNASVYTVMRSFNISSSLSMDIDLFIPVENGYSTYNVSGTDDTALEDETIKNALVGAGYVTAEDEVNYNAAELSYTGDLSGTSQTIWYASLSDEDNNVCRSTMLKIELPISFALGTLDFTLKEITSHFDV